MKKLFAIILFGLSAFYLTACSPPAKNTAVKTSTKSEIGVFLDVNKYWTNLNDPKTTVTEEELIQLLGKPDAVEEWNFITYDPNTGEKIYRPVKNLCYESNPKATLCEYTYTYSFSGNMLQRINIDGVSIPYSDNEDILPLFGLREYANSTVTDTGVVYRVTNCGVHDLWVVGMTETELNSIKISYSGMFEGWEEENGQLKISDQLGSTTTPEGTLSAEAYEDSSDTTENYSYTDSNGITHEHYTEPPLPDVATNTELDPLSREIDEREASNKYTTVEVIEDQNSEESTSTDRYAVANVEIIEDTDSSDTTDLDGLTYSSYMLNTKSHVFHYPNCSIVDKIDDSDKYPSDESREAITSQGYIPCKKCNP